MSKTRIEEAADKHVKQYENEPDKSWSRLDFIAGAEFMQEEVEKLEAQNEIMREALEFLFKEAESHDHGFVAEQALKKVGED